jgi:hypothetical protein
MCIRIQESEINADTEPERSCKPDTFKENCFSVFYILQDPGCHFAAASEYGKVARDVGKKYHLRKVLYLFKIETIFSTRNNIHDLFSLRVKNFKMRFHAIVEVS